MDFNSAILDLKKEPGFCEKVGMILIHNGVVRGISKNGSKVKKLKVVVSEEKIREIVSKYEKHDGIFKILVEARGGEFIPGEDLLWIIVAGDFRENVKKVLSRVLEEIKTRAIEKKEFLKEISD